VRPKSSLVKKILPKKPCNGKGKSNSRNTCPVSSRSILPPKPKRGPEEAVETPNEEANRECRTAEEVYHFLSVMERECRRAEEPKNMTLTNSCEAEESRTVVAAVAAVIFGGE